MRKTAGFWLILAAFMTLVARGADTDEKGKSFWMKKKLEHSQNILSALATEDFDAIGKNARTMNSLNRFEKWAHSKSPQYRTQLKLFGYANEELIRQADEENLDGCAVAYVQLTLSCVNCHRVMRESARQSAAAQPKKE